MWKILTAQTKEIYYSLDSGKHQPKEQKECTNEAQFDYGPDLFINA